MQVFKLYVCVLGQMCLPKIFSLSENLFEKQSSKCSSPCFNKPFMCKEDQSD